MIHLAPTTLLWFFLKPFSMELWVLLFATSVVVALVIFLLEVPWAPAAHQPRPSLVRYANLQWASAALLMHGSHQLTPRSTAGRLVALGYAFLVLILINM